MDYQELSKIIKMYPDQDKVEIKGQVFDGVLNNTEFDLIQWLYLVLHVGNPEIANLSSYDDSQDLTEKIIGKSNYKTQQYCEILDDITVSINGVKVKASPKDKKITLPCYRPNLSRGFCMFIKGNNSVNCRYYISFNDSETAIEFWKNTIDKLMNSDYEFSAKILSNSAQYPRNDAVVFYLNHKDKRFEDFLISQTKQYHFLQNKELFPVLCKKINEQIYYAEQPLESTESFGENRCKAIARAIKDYFTTGINFSSLLKKRFESFEIDPNRVYRNEVKK